MTDKTQQTQVVRQTVTVNATPETVYKALTEAKTLEGWFPTKAATDPRQGGPYRFEFADPKAEAHHVREGTFSAAEPARKLAYDWSIGSPGDPSRVTFTLEKAGAGTKVTLVHDDWGETPAEAVQMHDQGWANFLANLKSFLETGKDRRAELFGGKS